MSFLTFLAQLRKSDWTESQDAANFDVTFQAADEREANSEGLINPGTYYRSHVASMVGPSFILTLNLFAYSSSPDAQDWV